MKHKPCGPYEKYLKRPLDLLCGVIVVAFFWWLYVIVAILVRIRLGSPVLFTQKRPGRDGRIFKLYKFRTMTDARDEDGNLLPDEERLTKFGKLLRSTSLDELPEIFNIIRGDMSLIGPRPLLVEYLPYYTKEEMRRHDVRPGLTGLAQVNGRNTISWEKKFEYDLKYVDHITFLSDAAILLKTVIKVIDRSDIRVGNEFVAGKFIDQRKDMLRKNEKV